MQHDRNCKHHTKYINVLSVEHSNIHASARNIPNFMIWNNVPTADLIDVYESPARDNNFLSFLFIFLLLSFSFISWYGKINYSREMKRSFRLVLITSELFFVVFHMLGMDCSFHSHDLLLVCMILNIYYRYEWPL